jgi:hypothetical protein
MNEDYKELVEYLDGKFNGIDKRFDALPEIFLTREDAVTKNDFEGLKADFRDLQKSVDAYAVKADKFFQELVMLSNKVDRHEKWLLQIAEKLGLKLEY